MAWQFRRPRGPAGSGGREGSHFEPPPRRTNRHHIFVDYCETAKRASDDVCQNQDLLRRYANNPHEKKRLVRRRMNATKARKHYQRTLTPKERPRADSRPTALPEDGAPLDPLHTPCIPLAYPLHTLEWRPQQPQAAPRPPRSLGSRGEGDGAAGSS